jgi:hypothetical protein
LKAETLKLLRATVIANGINGHAVVNVNNEDEMITWVINQYIRQELNFYKRLTGDNGLWADTIETIIEKTLASNPNANDNEILDMTGKKFGELVGQEIYFAGHENDNAGHHIIRLLKLQKMIRV